jgi:hypothetical protein
MIRRKKTQKPTFASIFRSMREMPTGVSHGRETTAHRAVTGSDSRCLAEPSHALPPTPARRGEGLVPATLGERSGAARQRSNPSSVVESSRGTSSKPHSPFASAGSASGSLPERRDAELRAIRDDFRDAVLSRTFLAIRYLGPVRRVTRRAECRVPPAPRDKRERSTEDIRMTRAPAPEFE